MEVQEIYQKAYDHYSNGEYNQAIEIYEQMLLSLNDEYSCFQVYYNIAVCYKDSGYQLLLEENNSSFINDNNFPKIKNKNEIFSVLNKSLSILDILIKTINFDKKYENLYKDIVINHTDICLVITKLLSDNNSYIYRALVYDEKNYILYYNLGILNRNLENFYQAILFFKQSLFLNPKYSLSYNELSLLYRIVGDNLSAKQILEKGLVLIPNDYDIINNLAIIYMDIKNLKLAKELYLKTIKSLLEKRPDNYKTILNKIYVNLGCLYNKLGNPRLAVDCFNKALALEFHILAFQNKLLDINYLDEQETSLKYIEECPEVFEKMVKKEEIEIIKNHQIRKDKKIKIGYVSGDFKEHAVVFFIQSLLTIFNRQKFEVYAISTNNLSDQVIKSYPDVKFIKARHMKTKDIYIKIKELEIDVLVDLAGHTMYNNLTLFKAKAAPIQLTYIGYPNTTGLYEIDYKIVDHISDPVNSQQFYTEKLIRWPRIFLDYNPPEYLPDIVKIKTDKIIFGSTNRLSKITSEVLSAWREILKRVPNSLLYIKDRIFFDSKFVDHKDLQVINFFTPDERKRILFFDFCPSHLEHLQWLNNIHICLDTWPYSFTTGGMESLVMGVPVITKYTSNIHSSNVCASILYHAQMKDWISYTKEQYIELAVSKAQDIIKNGLDKNKIRENFLSSTICDHQNFIETYENTILELVEKI